MYSPKLISDISTPAFLVDVKRVRANCNMMLERCTAAGVKLRAQTKTHKSLEGCLLQTGNRKAGLVTSTLSEVEFYASHGFDDILYGYPLTADKVPRCSDINSRLSSFHIMIDAEHVIPALVATGQRWSVYVKLDCGNDRAGVWWSDDAGLALVRMLTTNNDHFVFRGLYVHCGNSYLGQSVIEETVHRLLHFKNRLSAEAGVKCSELGIGSTPTCSHATSLYSQLTELHPGNYIFYDAQQVSLGSCHWDSVACRVATRVIGHYPRRNQLLIDCGFTALSKQHGQDVSKPGEGYGVFERNDMLRLLDMTQEIGKVTTYDGSGLDYERYPVGTMLFIYPWHSCATAGLHPVYYVHEGETIVQQWTPNKGW